MSKLGLIKPKAKSKTLASQRHIKNKNQYVELRQVSEAGSNWLLLENCGKKKIYYIIKETSPLRKRVSLTNRAVFFLDAGDSVLFPSHSESMLLLRVDKKELVKFIDLDKVKPGDLTRVTF